MINKLLKKCMPWMDKGRWHSIRVDYDGSVFTPVYDNREFTNVEIDLRGGHVRVTCNHPYLIIDYKFCPNGREIEYSPNQVYIMQVSDGDDISQYTFDITFWGPGIYWFFMR